MLNPSRMVNGRHKARQRIPKKDGCPKSRRARRRVKKRTPTETKHEITRGGKLACSRSFVLWL
jgi:hypothetical protein